ncbi:hypothetical protein CBR_g19122 [Chara braunii]|uniref:Kinesin-like protein n=1 Tax=Chara braunii TaxID=69332 RepID=A0A388KXD4_CHABU|nr:hypothetical protein CBR_g19122 [Chara braunii]|eukprot:GBG74716.1 hypothetical protein CBR_g19122 [Chara braunii]
MLMSDTFGGNAKTLVFVNISQVHINLEETHSSQGYATRVGSITNEASRNIQSKEGLRLKKAITYWKEQVGKKVEGDDDPEQIQDTRPSKDKDDESRDSSTHCMSLSVYADLESTNSVGENATKTTFVGRDVYTLCLLNVVFCIEMNAESSRSHLFLSVVIESTNLQPQALVKRKLSFVDLGDSKRVNKSGSVGEQLKEAQSINKSFSALGDVISAFAIEEPHIPYRNHKPTMLMIDSLGGNAKTVMFVNISLAESNLEETYSSLGHETRVGSIRNTNLQTQALVKRNLSFVDLGDSERVNNPGLAGEQLKEAQSINKSLRALGDVISALATEEPHILYRNHKLTMLMSDSLGGNAKTVLFVNISPAESNLEETHSSLGYETRVGSKTNEASRNIQSKEVLKLKKAITYWKEQAGKKFERDDDLEEIQDTRPNKDKDYRVSCLKQDNNKFSFALKVYMLEMYQDTLKDLLLPKNVKRQKLDIKKDSKGMVVVENATFITVLNAQELESRVARGIDKRHVSGTQINAKSSRSHLILSFVIESTNLQTQAVVKGKLSFVDLAGSERLNKSVSVGEQLKETHLINKSLSALGDVISAFSTIELHIPYRNHKLTMLMSDTLGENAKTLMFVNISLAEINLEETHGSLGYATRVGSRTNEASRNI